MPYIKEGPRVKYDREIDTIGRTLEARDYPVGEVTYIVFKIIARWFLWNKSYQVIAEIRAMLMGCLSEFDRRFAFDYEDQKIKENGDVDLEYREEITECFCGQFNCEYHSDEEVDDD